MAINNTDGNKYISKSGCGSYISAFNDLYRQCQVSVPQDFEAALTKAFKGLLQAHFQVKEAKKSRLSEGKNPMPFALYKRDPFAYFSWEWDRSKPLKAFVKYYSKA